MTYMNADVGKHKSKARFWDRIANSYARKPVPDQQTYDRKLRITQDYLDADMDVLEFGCGTGSTALEHAPHARRIRAIDVSPRMIEIAQGKAAENGAGNVSFEVAAIDDFTAPDQSFDMVLGMSILHLLEDPEQAIGKVARLLKPGGVFVSSTACLGDGMKYFAPIAYIGRVLGLLPLVRIFTSRKLRENLVLAGFTIEHEWHPGKNKGVFIVAKLPEDQSAQQN